jgi:hypothetical protein
VAQGVIGDYGICAIGGVFMWVCHGKNVKRSEKLLKKKGRQKFFGGSLWRLVSVLKMVVKYFGRPLSKFLNTPLIVVVNFEVG